jgi:hypothetical protein
LALESEGCFRTIHEKLLNASIHRMSDCSNAFKERTMHLYAQGGHAFGLRHTKLPVTEWPQLMETWLGAIGMISE